MWRFAPLFAVTAALFISACASTNTSRDRASEVFPQRAEARWEALLAGDLETAYSYLSPGYRSTLSVVDWGVSQRMRRVKWT